MLRPRWGRRSYANATDGGEGSGGGGGREQLFKGRNCFFFQEKLYLESKRKKMAILSLFL